VVTLYQLVAILLKSVYFAGFEEAAGCVVGKPHIGMGPAHARQVLYHLNPHLGRRCKWSVQTEAKNWKPLVPQQDLNSANNHVHLDLSPVKPQMKPHPWLISTLQKTLLNRVPTLNPEKV
jgi:hypothetical protein